METLVFIWIKYINLIKKEDFMKQKFHVKPTSERRLLYG